jgi:hypothetical protein
MYIHIESILPYILRRHAQENRGVYVDRVGMRMGVKRCVVCVVCIYEDVKVVYIK